MGEISSRLPNRDELVNACELGCGDTGQCFLANIRSELTTAAFNAVTDNEALGDSPESFGTSFQNKAEVLKAIESTLAKCSLEQAAVALHPDG